jgi:hypothetical protein
VKLEYRAGRAGIITTGQKAEFSAMSFSEMDQTLNAVESLVKQVIAFETSADHQAVDKARAELLEGGNHAAAAIAKVDGNDEAGKAERAYAMDVMKALMNFNTTLTRWVSDLTMPLTKKIYQTSRTSLVLVEKSLGVAAKAVPTAA